MKVYISDYNCVLRQLRDKLDVTLNPYDADLFIIWQDVRGAMKTLVDINQEYLKKPVVVVQHGRGASRDYNAPNNFPLLADRICVWGEAEAERLEKYKDRVVVTGSPLVSMLRGVKRDNYCERTVIFTPIITTHEEVMNLEVFYELKKLEYTYAQEFLRSKQNELKIGWHGFLVDDGIATEGAVPWDIIRKNFFLVAKLTDIHDQKLYHGVSVKSSVCNIEHLEKSIKVLQNTSVMVGLEEGTQQLMASFLDIPTVIVEGFEYGSYGGIQDYKTELIRTDATAFCTLSNLRETIEQELTNPRLRQEARREVVRREFDPYPDKDPIETIIDVASTLVGQDIRREVVHA